MSRQQLRHLASSFLTRAASALPHPLLIQGDQLSNNSAFTDPGACSNTASEVQRSKGPPFNFPDSQTIVVKG